MADWTKVIVGCKWILVLNMRKANSSSALPVPSQHKDNVTLKSLTNWLRPSSGAWWSTEDNVLKSGKFIRDRIILNRNMWKRVTRFEIEMRWIRRAKSLIFTLADELEGIFDEKGYFSLTMVEMETCAYCVKSAIHPKKKEGHFLLRCDWAILLLILESTLRLDPVFFTGPQTESCKSIKSSERSTGFGCDNDLQKTTNGERMCLTHTHTHTHWCTIYTSLLQASWAISPTYCASCRLRWQSLS